MPQLDPCNAFAEGTAGAVQYAVDRATAAAAVAANDYVPAPAVAAAGAGTRTAAVAACELVEPAVRVGAHLERVAGAAADLADEAAGLLDGDLGAVGRVAVVRPVARWADATLGVDVDGRDVLVVAAVLAGAGLYSFTQAWARGGERVAATLARE